MAGRSKKSTAAACPCGSSLAYSRCCRRFHLGAESPATAEELMRARYSAYAKRIPSYIESTWHPATRPAELEFDPTLRWTGLTIVTTSAGGADDDHGVVEFVATFVGATGGGQLHEISGFDRVDGEWAYRSAR